MSLRRSFCALVCAYGMLITPGSGFALSAPAGASGGSESAAAQAQSAAQEAKEHPAAGFKVAADERNWEKNFQDGIVADNIRENMRRLSARPHHVGSPYDKDDAEWILARFKEYGLDAKIETFNVLFPTPKERAVELVEPTQFKAKLQEPAVAVDPTSNQVAEQLPTYNAYSIDGDVTAPLVYVNYGDREDYEQLDRLGISVKGAIVIARYGNNWRGIKPKVAGEHGAIGCIIYSDPKGDGYTRGDDYPTGGWRPKEGVQRGSVMDTDYPGDPLTPGVGATADAKRLPISEVKTITKIPVLPISYGDALPLLSALKGPIAPEEWRGGLGITYHVGPGPAKVHLKVKSNWDLKPVNDVIGILHGSDSDAQWVVRGNHFDAWVNGASDPISGQAPLIEEARMLGELHKQGWTPKRTIVYCAWDGEEPGLLGSTEWVETHAAELKEKTVAYINTDGNSRGFLSAGGTQDLERLVSDVAHDIQDPESKLTIYERAKLRAIYRAKDADARGEIRGRSTLRVTALGDGSDYCAFQDFVGIPSLDVSFDGEDEGDQYHSIYDDFYWYTHFDDTTFVYGRALAQYVGTMVMRLADADLLPYDYKQQAEAITKYEADLEKDLKAKQDEITEKNKELEEGVYSAITDPHKTLVPPPSEEVPPFINFAPLKNAIEALNRSAERYSQALAKVNAPDAAPLSAEAAAAVDADLIKVSRMFLDEKGLPERPWFKNQVYAPGAYTGYGAKPMAPVREYMDEKKWREAEQQVPRVAEAVQRAAAGIDKAASDLESAEKGR